VTGRTTVFFALLLLPQIHESRNEETSQRCMCKGGGRQGEKPLKRFLGFQRRQTPP
jgi:hypothetical protein